MKAAKLNTVLGVVFFATIAAFAVLSQTLKPSGAGVDGSASSIAPEGRRALHLLLESQGLGAELWSRSPALLPQGEHVLWMARAPDEWSAEEDTADADATEADTNDEDATDEAPPNTAERADTSRTLPSALDRHALAHYRRFAEEGGTIILPWNDDTRVFLIEKLGLAEFESITAVPLQGELTRKVLLSTGEEFRMERTELGFVPWDEDSTELFSLWTGESEESDEVDVLAAALPLGVGGIVVLAGDAWLDNARIRELDHAILAVRLVQEFHRGGSILLDEYALGLWTPETATGLAFSGRVFLFSANIVLLLVLFVWMRAWAGAFPRDPAVHEHVSALSRARVLADLYARAGRFAALGRALRVGVVRSVAPRALARHGGEDGARSRVDEEREWMDALRAQGVDDLDRWKRALTSRGPHDARELDELERDLAGLELRWKAGARTGILSR